MLPVLDPHRGDGGDDADADDAADASLRIEISYCIAHRASKSSQCLDLHGFELCYFYCVGCDVYTFF